MLKKIIVGLVSLALAAVALTGCSQPTGLVKGSSLVIGEVSYLSNLNSGVVGTTGQMRSNTDLAALTMPSFYSTDGNGALVANSQFGSVTATGNTVTYKLTGKASWSDKVPVSLADLALSWAAAVNQAQAGFNASSRASSLALATAIPQISPNKLVLTYDQLPPDWQTNLQITVPAHLVARQVYSASDMGAATDTDVSLALLQSIQDADATRLVQVAQAYNSVVALNVAAPTSAAQKEALVSAGPYLLTKVSANEAQLTVNPDFTWGPAPTVEKLTIKCFNGTKRLLVALNKSELDLVMPVETITTSYAQILTSLDAAGDLGISYLAGASQTQEVLLFSYRSRSAFAYNLSRSNAALVESARDAFRVFVPRSAFVTTLSPGSALTRSDSLVYQPGTSDYKATVKSNGSAQLQFQQAETASQVLAKGGHVQKVPIRVLFDSKNPRGQIEFGLLDRYAKATGFVLQNVSSVNPAQAFTDGAWDVYITNQQLLGSSARSLGAASSAVTGFKNQTVATLLASLAKSKDLTKETSKLQNLDQLLIKNGYGLPLFTLPNSVAYSAKLKNYSPNVATQSIVNGYWNWSVEAPAK